MYLLNLDKDVIIYTGDKAFLSVKETENFIKSYNHYKKYNYGRWAVIDKKSTDFIGWCGLKYTKELDEVDIGFRFFKKYWNQGFATESAKVCLNYGFENYNLKVIIGRAMVDNKASVKVLEKIGMTYIEEIDFEGKLGCKFSQSNPLL